MKEDFLSRKELEEFFGVDWRTLRRWEVAGMPVICLGSRRLYSKASIRSWMMAHERRPEPVKRGRPTDKRAA
jgi:phage terminase Nu1 subunit (DNA packaging protein)